MVEKEKEVIPGPPPLGSRIKLRALNFLFSMILRSPFHGRLSQNFVLLTFKGRKSGKKYTFPVGYLREDDQIQIISPRGWWKNLRGGNVSVSVLLTGKRRHGLAEAFHGDDIVAQEFERLARKFPSLIRMYKIELDASGQPIAEQMRQAARPLALIRIQLT